MSEQSSQPTNPVWRLRPADLTDALALQNDCLHHASLDRVRLLLQNVQRNARHNRGLGLVVEDAAGHLIGFGQLTLWARTAEISDLIVSETWRSQGIGSALITRLMEAARSRAKNRIEIGVALRNTRALALYRRLGFQEDRTLDLDIGDGLEPILFLRLDLPPTP